MVRINPRCTTYFNIFAYSTSPSRARLTSATVDASVFNTPHHKGGNPKSKIIDILSEPINVTSIDVVADEIAELVSNHTFNFRMDDTNNSTVVSFKPVAGVQSSTGN
jgi:hypothetical protein